MIQGRDARKFLGHFKCHSEPQISWESLKRGHVRSSEWIQHLQQKSLIQSVNGWVHDRFFCRHRHSGSVHCYSAAERNIYWRTQIWLNSLSVANFGFIRFVWPCLDNFDDICDLCHNLWMVPTILFSVWPVKLWRIKCPARNFRPPHWILPFIRVCFFFFMLL